MRWCPKYTRSATRQGARRARCALTMLPGCSNTNLSRIKTLSKGAPTTPGRSRLLYASNSMATDGKCGREVASTEPMIEKNQNVAGYFYLVHMGKHNLGDFSIPNCRRFREGPCYEFLSRSYDRLLADFLKEGYDFPVNLVTWDETGTNPDKMGVLVGPWSSNPVVTLDFWDKFKGYNFQEENLLTYCVVPSDPVLAKQIRGIGTSGDEEMDRIMERAYQAIDASMKKGGNITATADQQKEHD